MTISSSAALPALSPMPLMVPSTWRAPFSTPASVLATAMPRSSWQCTLMTARSMLGTFSRMRADQRAVLLRHGIAGGVGDIDHGGAGVDDGLRSSRTGRPDRRGPASSA